MQQSTSLFDPWRRAEWEVTRLTLNWRLALASNDGSPGQVAAIARLEAQLHDQRRIAHEEFQKALSATAAAAKALRCTRVGEPPPQGE